jgi:hypothetical protein
MKQLFNMAKFLLKNDEFTKTFHEYISVLDDYDLFLKKKYSSLKKDEDVIKYLYHIQEHRIIFGCSIFHFMKYTFNIWDETRDKPEYIHKMKEEIRKWKEEIENEDKM